MKAWVLGLAGAEVGKWVEAGRDAAGCARVSQRRARVRDIGLATDGTGIDGCRCVSRRLMRLTYDVRLVTPRVIPASSASHVQIVFMLCPTARAASMSGQSARIWPDLVAGFSARRRARRVRACITQSAEFMTSSFPGTDPLSTKRLPEAIGDGQQRIPARCAVEKPFSRTMGIQKAGSGRGPRGFLVCGRLRRITTEHGILWPSLAIKGVGCGAVGLPVSALPFQRLTAGCVSRPMHPVWDAPSFLRILAPQRPDMPSMSHLVFRWSPHAATINQVL